MSLKWNSNRADFSRSGEAQILVSFEPGFDIGLTILSGGQHGIERMNIDITMTMITESQCVRSHDNTSG